MLSSDLKQERLLSKAGDLVRAATALAGKRVPPELHVLLRSMNSYYTNRIEGQHTRPHEIEQALRKDFSANKELARGEFKSMLGLSDRLAADALGALVKRGYLRSDSPQGKVRFGLPQHALQFLFPKLWPEAEADVSV